MSAVTRSFLRYLVRRRGLSFLQLLGIACGVAAVVGMYISSQSAFISFARAVEFLRGEATHSLQRAAGPMGEDALERLMGDPAVRSFSPVVEGRIRLAGGDLVRLLGIDPFLDRSVHPAFARALAREGDRDRFLAFLLEESAVLAGVPPGSVGGLSAGASLETSVGHVRVAGVFPNPTGEGLLVMDIGHAQERLGRKNLIDRVDLVLSDESGFRARWEEGYLVRSVGEQRASLGGMLSAFRLNLQALSLMALFVGVFLIYNTTMFAVISRRKDAGILRSLGAGRRQIAVAFLAEMIVLGSCGGVLGGTLGFVLSRFLGEVVGRTISDLYFFLRAGPVPWSWTYPGAGLVLGIFSSMLGAAWPLAHLLRVDPVAALQGRTPPSSAVWKASAAAAAGGILISLSLLPLAAGTPHIYLGFAAAFAFLAGSSLLAGLGIIVLHPLVRRILGFAAGLPGRVAAGVIRQNLGRTAVATAAFMVALALSVGIGSMIDSFRGSLERWMEGQLRADLYLGSRPEVRIPEGLYEELGALDGIGGIDRYSNREALFEGASIRIAAIDADVLGKFARFWWMEGGDESWESVRKGAVIVSESFARRFDTGAGGAVTLETIEGPRSFPVAGVFYDYSSEHGLIMVDRAVYLEIFEDSSIATLSVFLEPGRAGDAEVIARVLEAARRRGLPTWTKREFDERILAVFDSTFTVTRSMRVLAIVTALFAVTGALLSLFLERRREFGIYRALGFSGPQVAAMTLMEGLGIAAVSFLLCAPAGTGLALILIKVINLRSFNWTIFFSFTWGPYLAAAATAAAAGVTAALYPAWKVLRTYPRIQLRED